jgi:hypothetical protein
MAEEVADCPTPHKKWFRSAAEARRWNVHRQQQGCPRLWPYPCKCGGFHLTNQNYDEQKRIGKAIEERLGYNPGRQYLDKGKA